MVLDARCSTLDLPTTPSIYLPAYLPYLHTYRAPAGPATEDEKLAMRERADNLRAHVMTGGSGNELSRELNTKIMQRMFQKLNFQKNPRFDVTARAYQRSLVGNVQVDRVGRVGRHFTSSFIRSYCLSPLPTYLHTYLPIASLPQVNELSYLNSPLPINPSIPHFAPVPSTVLFSTYQVGQAYDTTFRIVNETVGR